MNLAQLEKDLAAKKEQLAALVDTSTRAAAAEVVKPASGAEPAVVGRLLTDQELGAIKALQAECVGIKAQIDRARGVESTLADVERLTADARPPAAPALPALADRQRALMLSAGAQFTAAPGYRELIKREAHKSGGVWSTGAIECVIDMMATTLTSDPASGGKLITPQYLPGVQQILFKRLVVAALMAQGTTSSNSIVYMVETLFTNAAAPVLEGAAKPESALAFDQHTDPVSKIAHWLPVTEELLEDVAAIASYIDARLQLGVQLAEEDQLLNGNGTAPNLLGLLNRPGLAAPVARNAGATPPETNADAVLRQISAIATSAFVFPDGIVMNPANLYNILVSKDSSGQYYGGGPFSAVPATASLWGLPVAPTPSIVAGTALVGAFSSQAQIFRKGGIRVEASNSHQDYFVKNLVAIRAEERLALAVYRPGAFGKVTGLL
jgi:HK97 family phage major capsid protein